MLARQTFKTARADLNITCALHVDTATLMVWVGDTTLEPAVLQGEELSRFIRWLTDPEFKG